MIFIMCLIISDQLGFIMMEGINCVDHFLIYSRIFFVFILSNHSNPWLRMQIFNVDICRCVCGTFSCNFFTSLFQKHEKIFIFLDFSKFFKYPDLHSYFTSQFCRCLSFIMRMFCASLISSNFQHQ